MVLSEDGSEVETSRGGTGKTDSIPSRCPCENKTITGMLPICASCKKIRDDKGYWNQLEIYIEEHSEAEFTHGICPDCMKTFYGSSLEEDSNRKRE